jgi:predicted nicotinamide N-methyase
LAALRLRYQTYEFDNVDIHTRTLRDRQEFLDINEVAEKLGISSASWSLFGVVWDSSEVLAHLMFDYQVANKRILEVGCGIALASLILNHRRADITATDYHPETEAFLEHNTELNQGPHIPFTRTGWADDDSGLGKFDMIIGSDVLYESEHVALLAAFIQQHANVNCEVILVDPGRGNHARFSKEMIKLGYTHAQQSPADSSYLDKPFKGQILSYKR